MKNLTVTISDLEYSKFGISDETLSFSDFLELVSRELIRQNLNKCLELALKHGFSTMTMEEITSEVQAVRNHAKNRH
jgi:predicted CopG family antitoxin